jgi:hypothetical protein
LSCVFNISVDKFDGNLVCSQIQLIAAEFAVHAFTPKGSSFDFCWQIVSDTVKEEDFFRYRALGFWWYIQ